MSRRKIVSKNVDGFTVTELDVRIVSMPLYPTTNNVVNVFYGYFSDNKRIGSEGNLQLGDLISSDSKTALLDALTAQVGAVIEATLLLHQVKDGPFSIKYKKSDGTEGLVRLTGSYFTSSEYNAIISAVMTATSSNLNEWSLRKEITVNSTSSTNYQISFTLHNTTGTDTISDIYLGSNVRSDWGDVRIKSADGTALPFSITYQDSTSITIEVLVSLISGDNTFYIYYGRSATSSPYKIALLTDTHYDASTDAGVNRTHSLDYIDNFVARMTTYLPDLAVNNGDKTGAGSTDEATQLSWYQSVLDHFAPVSAHAGEVRDGVTPGNHDFQYMHLASILAKHTAETWMEAGVLYGYFETPGYRFISLDANYATNTENHMDYQHQGNGYINPTQLAWLTNTLNSSTKPCIIFVHQPLAEETTDQQGKTQTPSLTKEIYHTQNRTAVRTVLENSGKVVCVISGHVHWHRLDVINGIPYLTMNDLLEAQYSGEPISGTTGNWSLIELDKDSRTIRFKMEAMSGGNYYTVADYLIPMNQTIYDTDIAYYPEKVYASGNAATFGRASILSDCCQFTANDPAFVYTHPVIAYSEPKLSPKTFKIVGVTSSPNFGRLYFAFAPQTGDFRMKFAVNLSAQTNKLFKIYNTNDASAAAYICFRPTGNISAFNTSGTETVLQAYSLNTWYQIEIVVYISTSKYDVVINGVKQASLFSFYSANTTLQNLEIITEAGNCFIDNMRIEKYASTAPSITAVGSEENI
jgi:3',5'-cyclic AMP phosphodiesterase CpdA